MKQTRAFVIGAVLGLLLIIVLAASGLVRVTRPYQQGIEQVQQRQR